MMFSTPMLPLAACPPYLAMFLKVNTNRKNTQTFYARVAQQTPLFIKLFRARAWPTKQTTPIRLPLVMSHMKRTNQ